MPSPQDEALRARAEELSARYLGGLARPSSVRWVSTMSARWASCTPGARTIRVSDRLVGAPGYVLDYVLLHELVHLFVPGHGADFWTYLEAYPDLHAAKDYLARR